MSIPTQSEYSALVGTVIANKYMVERLLGAGGMGLVFLAHHIDLARPVAVKLIRRELMETESIAERFLREARAAARIQSEHVGRVLDVGRLESGEPFIVMEYLEGVDLAEQLLVQRRFAPDEAVDLILEAGEAIAEAHQSRIVHRDLKPENLFLARQPDGGSIVKVLDFGISKQLGESSQRVLTSPSTALGSPQYMAPEQMEGAHVDVRADIWALGAILYELVCGRKAFEGETLAQVCVQVLAGSITPVRELAPEVPAGLAVAIEQCLQPDRHDRFDNMSALANALMPYGSERARLSASRIARVLGLKGPDDKRSSSSDGEPLTDAVGGNRTRSFALEDAGNLKREIDPMLRTEVATPVARQGTVGLPASSHTVAVNRSSSRWPIFLGLAAVIVLGGVLWVFTRNAVSELEAQGEPGASAAVQEGLRTTTVLEPTPPKPNAGDSQLRRVEEGRMRQSTGIHSEAGTAAVAPKREVNAPTEPKPNARTPAGQKRTEPSSHIPARRPAPEQAASVPPEKPLTPQQRAFDRDSFGGRR